MQGGQDNLLNLKCSAGIIPESFHTLGRTLPLQICLHRTPSRIFRLFLFLVGVAVNCRAPDCSCGFVFFVINNHGLKVLLCHESHHPWYSLTGIVGIGNRVSQPEREPHQCQLRGSKMPGCALTYTLARLFYHQKSPYRSCFLFTYNSF